MPITKSEFGATSSRGSRVHRWTLTNGVGAAVDIIDYGATIASFKVPARNGEIVDVVLGFDDIESYSSSPYYFGCTVGRCANRIGGAAFDLDGRSFQLAANNGVNHLHGGVEGFDKKMWQLVDEDDETTSLSLRHESADGEEGYPGNVDVTVTFSLDASSNVLLICYSATTDAPSVVNLTNHSYFNLSGHRSGNIYDQNLQIFGGKYLKTDEAGLSVGDPTDVEGTVFDYREPIMIGYRLEHMVTADNPHGGLDNSFCEFPIDASEAVRVPNSSSSSSSSSSCVCSLSLEGLKPVAVLTSDQKKIRLVVSTTKPAVHVYSGNYLDAGASCVGKEGFRYSRHGGICFETQIHPNAVNRPDFPTSVLRPEQRYHHVTVFDVHERPSLQWT